MLYLSSTNMLKELDMYLGYGEAFKGSMLREIHSNLFPYVSFVLHATSQRSCVCQAYGDVVEGHCHETHVYINSHK